MSFYSSLSDGGTRYTPPLRGSGTGTINHHILMKSEYERDVGIEREVRISVQN